MAEPRPMWRKSSYSGTPSNECVECALSLPSVLVRDSKRPDGARFSVSKDAWSGFTRAVRANTLCCD
ncbi:DUF397 domain-containing protein [Streptomyces sp. RFCAC02]|uniref:DUF397 domain-containing protein n=1 Tax=Streptomyces sp. RFCAC02 TaxID=2499143 RepID=UPI0010219D37|nr:DUF397 domain-containing protein [Streptomyces sp. RFCAC02]